MQLQGTTWEKTEIMNGGVAIVDYIYIYETKSSKDEIEIDFDSTPARE